MISLGSHDPRVVARLLTIILGWYAVASVVTFMVYGVDKAASRRGVRRAPESTLHLLAVFGGWPGALMGQRRFSHKTRKQPFQSVFRVTVIGNCIATALLVWWMAWALR